MRKVYTTLALLVFGCYVQAQIRTKVDSLVASSINLKLPLPAAEVKGLQKEIEKKISDSLLSVKKSLLLPVSPFINNLKSPLLLNHAEAFYGGSYDNSFMGSPSYLSNGFISVSGTVLGVPLEFVNRNGNWLNNSTENFSFRFDRSAYLKQLQNSFKSKVDGKKLLSSISDPLLEIKRHEEEALKTALARVNGQFENLLADDIKQLGGFEQIAYGDISTIRNQMQKDGSLTALGEMQTQFEQLNSRKNLGEPVDSAQYNQLLSNIRKADGQAQLLQSVEGFKKKWQASGLLSKMREMDALKQAGFEKALSDPSTLITVAKRDLNLNSFQRFFLKVNKLNLGQNTVNGSSLSFQNFLNAGGVTEFLNKGKSLMLLTGKTREGASILDMPFTNSVFSNSVTKALQIGRAGGNGDVHVSFASFQEGFNTIGNLSGLNQFRRSFVTTFSKDFNFGKYAHISTEVSRSISSYNAKSGGDNSSGLQKLLSADNLSSNTSFNITYQDEYPGSGLNYQVHVKKVALGYDNPGNPFLNAGGQEGGVTVRKSFLQKRLQLMIREDLREYNYSQSKTDKWRNSYSVFDVKWKLNRSSYISVRYMPNQMTRFDDLGKHRATTLNYLSFDGNFNKRIDGCYYNAYSSLLYQKNQFASGLVNYEANNVGLVLNQSLAIKKVLIYWNSQLNRSQNNSQLVYLNSSINSEMGTSLNVLKFLNLSTCISYNSIDKWYSQIGGRETLDVLINKKFSLGGFIDVRKNLKLYQPLIFGLVRGSIQAHYNFK